MQQANSKSDLGLWLENPLTKACGDCKYLQGIFDGAPFRVCMYLDMTGHRRGCPGDARCTRRTPRTAEPRRRCFIFGRGTLPGTGGERK